MTPPRLCTRGSLRLATLVCVLLFAAAGFAARAGLTQAPAPANKSRGNDEVFVITGDAAGQTGCRVATPEEQYNLLRPEAARPGRVLVYPGASRRTDLDGLQKDAAPRAVTTESGRTLLPSAGIRVVLHGTEQLNSNPAARDAFIVAANRWEALISTQITVVIDVDFGPTIFGQPWPAPGIRGAASTSRISHRYPRVRQQLLAAAPQPAEATLYNALPAASIPVDDGYLPREVAYLRLALPLARALGLEPDVTNPDGVPLLEGDSHIAFNSAHAFDFNPDDGIASDAIDFDAVAVHEIGHSLGFISEAGSAFSPSPLDLYRFRPGAVIPGELWMLATARRFMFTGGEQLFFSNRPNTFGGYFLGLSTGGPLANTEDFRQSSHWKDDALSGTYIGIMDPTITTGVRRVMTDNDKLAFDTFGYRLDGTAVTPPAPPPMPPPPNDDFANAVTLSGIFGAVRGDTANATGQPGEPDHAGVTGDGRHSVWYTWTAPTGGNTSINTHSSDFDTALAVYTGDAVGGLTLVASNDDFGGSTGSSAVFFEAVAGTTYRIAVDGYQGDAGAFRLTWDIVLVRPGPALMSLPAATATVSERQGTFGILINRTGDLALHDDVRVDVLPGTATAGSDFYSTNGSITSTFLPNRSFIVLPFLFLIDDSTPEPNETLTIRISRGGTNAGVGPVTEMTLTIVDDDTFPANTVGVSGASARSLAEGGEPGKIDFTVTRAGDLSQPASVAYKTEDGTAADTQDYTFAGGTLNFAAGEASKTFSVLVNDDFKDEPDETFVVALGAAADTTIDAAHASVQVTITDDDPPGLQANPIDRTQDFVAQHYRDFLNRAPDADGLAFWSQGIESCGADAECRRVKRVDTSAAFFLSIEFQETGFLVHRMYRAAYGFPSALTFPPVRFQEFMTDTQEIGRGVVVGAADWQARLEANKRAFALAFVRRARFLSMFPQELTPGQFVDRLDENSGGLLTPARRAALVTSLTNGGNSAEARADVLRQVADNQALRDAEFRRAFVLMQYFGYLRRNPDDPGFDGQPDPNYNGYKFWLNKLDSFGGDFRAAEMTRAFIESIEYRRRFGQ
ncbi:MAG TPA: NF038122 family metalloprotease [Pyrinomonadaceae bacterium]|jgi:hypothetical protein